MAAEHIPAGSLRTVDSAVVTTLRGRTARQCEAFIVHAPRGRWALACAVPEGFRVERVIGRPTLERLEGLGLIERGGELTEVGPLAGMPTPKGRRRAPYTDAGYRITLTRKGRIA